MRQQQAFSRFSRLQRGALALAIAALGGSAPVGLTGVVLLGAPLFAAAADTVAPSVPTNVASSAITASGFTVSWTASTDNVAVAGYQVWIGNAAHSVAATATSFAVTGLSAATSYNVVVRAVDAAGNYSALSPVLKVTTTGAVDTTPPTTPGTPTVSAINTTGFSVHWAASTDNVGVTGYEIWLGNSVTKVAGTVTSYTFSGLATDSKFNLSIRARDAAGNLSPLTAALPVQLGSPDTQAPTAPGALSFSNVSTQAFTVSWGASTDNVGVTGYQVWVGSTAYAVAANATSYTVSGLSGIPTSNIGVRARDAAGNWSAITLGKVTASAGPTTPGTPVASAISSSGFTVSWAASSDANGVTGYLVSLNGGAAQTVTSTSKTFTSLSAATAYSVSVIAIDAANNQSAAATTSVTTSAASTPPTEPGIPVASAITSTGFTVNWTASTDAVGVTGYLVSLNGGTAQTVTGTSQTFTGLTASTAYTVAVQATDAAGNLSPTASTSVTTAAAVSPTAAVVYYYLPYKGWTSADIYYEIAGGTWTTSPGTVMTAACTNWVTSTVNLGTAANMAAVFNNGSGSWDNQGNVSGQNYTIAPGITWVQSGVATAKTASPCAVVTVPDTTPPTVPLNPLATVTNTTVVLNWTASTDNVAVTGYQITRTGGTQGTTVLTSTTNSYTDSGLTATTAYIYTIKAFDAAGNYSTASASVTATTGAANSGGGGTATGVPNSKYYATNPNGQVGAYQTITVDGTGTGFTEANIIAQGVANDDPRIFRGSHEGPVYDLYALYAAWDDTNLYLMWQYTNVTDVADPAQSYPISGNGKPYNGDIPQMLAFNVNNNANGAGGDAVLSTGAGVWGVTVSFPAKNLDHLLMFSSKPGVGTPSVFTLNSSKTFDYTVANTVPFKTAGVFFKYSDAFLPKHMYGINNNGNSGYLPTDLTNTSAFIDFLTTTHSTAQDTVYEMQIPLAALGLTRATLESKGIGVMLVQTFGVSGINFLPYDPTQLDNALLPYSADTSTSHEKEDIDVVSQPFARIGHL